MSSLTFIQSVYLSMSTKCPVKLSSNIQSLYIQSVYLSVSGKCPVFRDVNCSWFIIIKHYKEPARMTIRRWQIYLQYDITCFRSQVMLPVLPVQKSFRCILTDYLMMIFMSIFLIDGCLFPLLICNDIL